MEKRSFSMVLAIGAALLLGVSGVWAEEPSNDPLEIDSTDILKFLGAHAWKWTYHPATHYKEITVQLVHYTRTSATEFKRAVIHENKITHGQWCVSDDILIISGQKDDRVTFMVSFTNIMSEQSSPTDLKSVGYVSYGTGNGGTPGQLGSELLLMARFIEGRESENKKENILDYVAVEIDAK